MFNEPCDAKPLKQDFTKKPVYRFLPQILGTLIVNHLEIWVSPISKGTGSSIQNVPNNDRELRLTFTSLRVPSGPGYQTVKMLPSSGLHWIQDAVADRFVPGYRALLPNGLCPVESILTKLKPCQVSVSYEILLLFQKKKYVRWDVV